MSIKAIATCFCGGVRIYFLTREWIISSVSIFRRSFCWLFLFIRYIGFKSRKDETSCLVLVCFLSLSMWHSAVCNEESYISLEWISLQELSWLSAQGSPCLSSTGRRMKVNASVLPVILKLAWTALHCFTQKKEPCIFWHIFQYQYLFSTVFFLILALIVQQWWLARLFLLCGGWQLPVL